MTYPVSPTEAAGLAQLAIRSGSTWTLSSTCGGLRNWGLIMTGEVWQEFSGKGVRATLSCRWGRCRFDVVVDAAVNAWPAVAIEVLAQPRDAAGLPQGPPIVLHKQTIKLRRSHDRQRLLGGCRLPTSIRPQLARKCYYRVRPAHSERDDLTAAA